MCAHTLHTPVPFFLDMKLSELVEWIGTASNMIERLYGKPKA